MAIIKIRSRDDPRISAYRALPAHDARRRDGLFVAETRTVVRQLLESTRFATRSVLLTESSRSSLDDCLARRPDVPAYVAPVRVLESIVGFEFHRGCVALGERGAEPALDDLLAEAPRRLVLLEGVNNPDNVGGVLRAARALGADAAVLSPGCCDPLYRKAVRVSMGAALTLPFTRVADWERAQARLRGAGFVLVALTPTGDRDVAALPPQDAERTALLVGAEGEGLRAESIAAADTAVRIPMVPGVDSLNLVTACAIALDRLGWSRNPRTPS
jgi:tRNA G18 (ribose-2'-O)-methylase SpoU